MATWNTLATAYIRAEYYPRTPPEILRPTWRIPALVAHAQALAVDILCLQEVEVVLFRALQQTLVGYDGVHAMKGGPKPEGCATFFRTGLFTLLNNRRVEYRDHSGTLLSDLLLGQEGRASGSGPTQHLKWDPDNAPREKQLGYGQILQAIELFEEGSRSGGQMVCGDFNAIAESDVVRALAGAGFRYAHEELPGISTSTSNGSAKARDRLPVLAGGPLKAARAVAPMPIDETTPLPSRDQPSDHLPLVAGFEWL